mmetsp:Transcript_18605/g.44610  ORF Transcript_18605/g.44610 Transcript_18605/m.44610 type:complete len:261 (+) Transcript_18605:758-1540(+)
MATSAPPPPRPALRPTRFIWNVSRWPASSARPAPCTTPSAIRSPWPGIRRPAASPAASSCARSTASISTTSASVAWPKPKAPLARSWPMACAPASWTSNSYSTQAAPSSGRMPVSVAPIRCGCGRSRRKAPAHGSAWSSSATPAAPARSRPTTCSRCSAPSTSSSASRQSPRPWPSAPRPAARAGARTWWAAAPTTRWMHWTGGSSSASSPAETSPAGAAALASSGAAPHCPQPRGRAGLPGMTKCFRIGLPSNARAASR